MGGATEDDNAMIWFLQQAAGGDILVLRASGSDGYNNYLYSGLGVSVNSVETIVFHNALASSDPYIHQRIQKAEAIWLAGGDQWDYISYWRDSPIDSLINEGLTNRNMVIGGTSAGMAVLGQYYFSAQNGTVTSTTALANPYNPNVTVDSAHFLGTDNLQHVITDTHYDNPDRKGRHVVFLARIVTDLGVEAKGIACDEYTAVCIDPVTGIAQVFGGFPQYDDFAYFLQPNCELIDASPEGCIPGSPLDWDRGGEAIKVCRIPGTPAGSNTFSLQDWETQNGGNWENWSVSNGTLSQQPASAPNCLMSSITETREEAFTVYPNPAADIIRVRLTPKVAGLSRLIIRDATGRTIRKEGISNNEQVIQVSDLPAGIYTIELNGRKVLFWRETFIKQ